MCRILTAYLNTYKEWTVYGGVGSFYNFSFQSKTLKEIFNIKDYQVPNNRYKIKFKNKINTLPHNVLVSV